MTNTAEPCSKGNCVLAGHNGSRRGVYFTYLSNIEAGAKVFLTNKSREKQKSGVSKEQTKPSARRDGWQEARDTPFR